MDSITDTAPSKERLHEMALEILNAPVVVPFLNGEYAECRLVDAYEYLGPQPHSHLTRLVEGLQHLNQYDQVDENTADALSRYKLAMEELTEQLRQRQQHIIAGEELGSPPKQLRTFIATSDYLNATRDLNYFNVDTQLKACANACGQAIGRPSTIISEPEIAQAFSVKGELNTDWIENGHLWRYIKGSDATGKIPDGKKR